MGSGEIRRTGLGEDEEGSIGRLAASGLALLSLLTVAGGGVGRVRWGGKGEIHPDISEGKVYTDTPT